MLDIFFPTSNPAGRGGSIGWTNPSTGTTLGKSSRLGGAIELAAASSNGTASSGLSGSSGGISIKMAGSSRGFRLTGA
jgi:hypothetical protein